MAERIDHQMQRLRVQSSIDHEILNGLNVARVLQRVAHRLEQVVPGATACVVEFDRTSRLLARVHRAGTAMSIIGLPRADAICLAQMPIEETVLCNDPPGWLLGLTTGSSHRWVRCARSGDELLAMLVIGAGDHAIDDSDTQREIAELCNRVSVTLASADRERRLLERATHDNLTGLANRAGLYESIDAQLAEDLPASFSVLFVDLDRFKEVNDSMGHQIGDELLRAVAERLQQRVPRAPWWRDPEATNSYWSCAGPDPVPTISRARCAQSSDNRSTSADARRWSAPASAWRITPSTARTRWT
jgi:hypothetical protein